MCKKTLPVTEFHRASKDPASNRLQSRCMECGRNSTRKWMADNPSRVRVHGRKSAMRKRYGDDAMERYDVLYALQGGRCAICGKEERFLADDGRMTRLAMDHCHDTGKVRGLLCRSCNGLLGQIGDSVEGVARWFDYVQSPPGYALPDDLSKPKRWAFRWDACIECGTTEVRHSGHGRCHNCYNRWRREAGKDA